MLHPNLRKLAEEYRQNRDRLARLYRKEDDETKKRVLGQMKRDQDWIIFYMEQGYPPEENPYFRETGTADVVPVDPNDLDTKDPSVDRFLWSTFFKYAQDHGEEKSIEMSMANIQNILTEKQWEVVRRRSDDWSLRDIAKDLGIDHKTVQEHIDLSKQKLRKVLKQRKN